MKWVTILLGHTVCTYATTVIFRGPIYILITTHKSFRARFINIIKIFVRIIISAGLKYVLRNGMFI